MFKMKKREILLIIIIFFIIYLFYIGRKLDNNDKFVKEKNWANAEPVAMNDPRLINEIKDKFLIPPVDQTLHPLSLENPNRDFLHISERGEAAIINNYLNNKIGGFFIEVGALDGEAISNTLFFEVQNNWTGLLIEANPINFSNLKKKNRRAWISNTCVSINPYPEIVDFEPRYAWGKIIKTGVKKGEDTQTDVQKSEETQTGVKKGEETQTSIATVQVQCIPLYSYLLALNITHVDYFSLDVEGFEFKVLKTIPFQLIDIQTLSVETQNIDVGPDPVAEYMISQGYEVHKKLPYDLIFVKKKNGILHKNFS